MTTDLRTDSERLAAKVDPALARLRAVPRRIADVVNDYRSKGHGLLTRFDLADEMRAKGRDILRHQAAQELAKIEAEVQEAVADATTAVHQARRKRLRATRRWSFV